MARATNSTPLLWSAAAISGSLQVIIFPRPAISILAWVALAPLLWALLSRQLSQGKAFLLGYLSGVIWYVGSCYWVYHVMHLYGGLQPAVAVGVLLLFALYLGLYHGLFGLLLVRVAQRMGIGFALLASPVLWVAVELARARITGFPWDLLGTAQVDNIPLTQLAPITGVYGVSLVIAAVNALFAWAVLVRERRALWAVAAAAIAAVLQCGVFVHPQPFPTTHTATLVQQNIPILDQGGWTVDYFDQTLAGIVDLSRTVSSKDSPAPRLIVWPESPAPFFSEDPKLRNWLSTLAADRQGYIIAGSLGAKRTGRDDGSYQTFNSAALIAPSGAMVSRYDKIHLVPFGEYVPFKSLLVFAEKLTREVGDFSPGTERSVFVLSAGEATEQMRESDDQEHEHMMQSPPVSGESRKLAVFICYESIFPDEIRQFADRGAELLVNISNDGWFGASGAPGQHLNMARMRAIENHRWLLRSTNTGITGSIDPYGRVISRAEPNVRIALNAPYSFISGTTFYTRHGDWFAWCCAIITVLLLFARLRIGVISP